MEQTLAARIADASKTPLHGPFVQWVRDVARANGKTEDEVYAMWQNHVRMNTDMDQSPTTSEFITWNKLKWEGLR